MGVPSVAAEPCEGCGGPAFGALLCPECQGRMVSVSELRRLNEINLGEAERARLIREEARTLRILGRINARLAHHRLTPERWHGLIDDQGGRCAICRHRPDDPAELIIDHNHATGVVRGLLCSRCNTALGLLKDSPAITDAALAYLEERGHYGPDELS